MTMAKKFQRRIENFHCEQCAVFVEGNGYRNHCPQCLYSKHVDVNPGDRAAECGGLMKPIRVELDHGKHVLLHQCVQCGFERRNKVQDDDLIDALVNVSRTHADAE